MTKVLKVIALGSLLASTSYAASLAACAGCHGQHFEKKAMGKSKIVKDMSQADILVALKGYKAGTYGGGMKGLMKGQVANLSDADMKSMAEAIKAGGGTATDKATVNAASAAVEQAKVINLNAAVCTPERLAEDDLGNKKVVTESRLGLRKTDLYSEDDTTSMKTHYSDAAPGTSKRLERAFQDAPPMIPHSVEGLLPIKAGNNQCLGCHMPDVAKSMGATPIPKSHFTDFRPKHKVINGVFKKSIDNYKNEVAISKPKDKLVQARFNCSQCHAPQSTGDLAVSNTFQGGFSEKNGKMASDWYEHMTDDLATVGEKDSVVTPDDIANKNSPAGASPWTHH